MKCDIRMKSSSWMQRSFLIFNNVWGFQGVGMWDQFKMTWSSDFLEKKLYSLVREGDKNEEGDF